MPKTCRVLDPNLWRGTFGGVCFCAPTRVYEKFGGFHISPPEYTKNAPDFTFPNRDTYKTYPVLGANPCRRTFRGVCNTPLHGYMKNLLGFTFPHTDTSKTHPISSFPIGIHPKPARFYTQTFVAGHLGAYAIRHYRVHEKPARFYTQTVGEGHFGAYAFAPLHGYVKNAPDFIIPN